MAGRAGEAKIHKQKQKIHIYKKKTGNPGVQPISSRTGSAGWYPILALTDANYFNGTPIRRDHESISARCNRSSLHSDEEQWERREGLKPGQNEAHRRDGPRPARTSY